MQMLHSHILPSPLFLFPYQGLFKPKEFMEQSQEDQYIYCRRSRKRREKEKWVESLCKEITAQKFLNLGKLMDIQMEESHQTPYRKNPRKSTCRHSIIKLLKVEDKERNLKEAGKKRLITYKRTP